MATVLGLEVCNADSRTKFASCFGLTNELLEVEEKIFLQRTVKRYSRYDLLILDELGYIPFTKEGAELLF